MTSVLQIGMEGRRFNTGLLCRGEHFAFMHLGHASDYSPQLKIRSSLAWLLAISENIVNNFGLTICRLDHVRLIVLSYGLEQGRVLFSCDVFWTIQCSSDMV